MGNATSISSESPLEKSCGAHWEQWEARRFFSACRLDRRSDNVWVYKSELSTTELPEGRLEKKGS
jgi:hypothetical protein